MSTEINHQSTKGLNDVEAANIIDVADNMDTIDMAGTAKTIDMSTKLNTTADSTLPEQMTIPSASDSFESAQLTSFFQPSDSLNELQTASRINRQSLQSLRILRFLALCVYGTTTAAAALLFISNCILRPMALNLLQVRLLFVRHCRDKIAQLKAESFDRAISSARTGKSEDQCTVSNTDIVDYDNADASVNALAPAELTTGSNAKNPAPAETSTDRLVQKDTTLEALQDIAHRYKMRLETKFENVQRNLLNIDSKIGAVLRITDSLPTSELVASSDALNCYVKHINSPHLANPDHRPSDYKFADIATSVQNEIRAIKGTLVSVRNFPLFRQS